MQNLVNWGHRDADVKDRDSQMQILDGLISLLRETNIKNILSEPSNKHLKLKLKFKWLIYVWNIFVTVSAIKFE